ncbi:MAG: lipid-binding SYLF domain-containing protein [Isosphaeraceae bacterium]
MFVLLIRLRTALVGPLLALTLWMSAAGSTLAQTKEIETISRAGSVLSEVVATNKRDLSPAVLKGAEAVIIVPHIVKAGFLVAGRFGRGVLVVRNGGGWSDPLFLTVGGASFGLQAGGQATDLVMVFKSRKGLETFLKGNNKMTLGANGSFAFGERGKFAEAGVGLKSQYVAVSRNQGLFAGASLSGTGLMIDHKSNAAFYGGQVAVSRILAGEARPSGAAGASAAMLSRLVAERTGVGAPKPTVVQGRPASEPRIIDDEEEPARVSRRSSTRPSQPSLDPDDPPADDPPPRTSSSSKSTRKAPPRTTTTEDTPAFPF